MQLPIVDTNDNVIGYKSRDEIDYSKDIFRTASLWITNSSGDVLIAQRLLNKIIDPGKWAEAVGGTVEGDESYKQTVIREAEEELGLSGLVIYEGPKQFITTPCRYFVQWYTATIDKTIEDFTIQIDEVEKIAWIPKQTLIEEIKENPTKYIDVMSDIVELIYDKNKSKDIGGLS